jgi:hypothetical protein
MLTDFLEDTVMVSACFFRRIASLIVLSTIVSYLYYADALFSSAILILGFLYLFLSYKFYIKNISASRDVLLDILEKKGRKELQIDDETESIKLFSKVSSCELPAHPANAKEFTVSILYLGKEQLTIYSSCPKSHIYKIHKKKAPGTIKAKAVQACAESREYYYSYIQSVHFKKDIILILNSGEEIPIPAAKGPAKKTVVKIRKFLRQTEKNWVDHSRGSHNIRSYD